MEVQARACDVERRVTSGSTWPPPVSRASKERKVKAWGVSVTDGLWQAFKGRRVGAYGVVVGGDEPVLVWGFISTWTPDGAGCVDIEFLEAAMGDRWTSTDE